MFSFHTCVKFSQHGGPYYDKIEKLGYSAKSMENGECYHMIKNKNKVIATNFFMGVKVGNSDKQDRF